MESETVTPLIGRLLIIAGVMAAEFEPASCATSVNEARTCLKFPDEEKNPAAVFLEITATGSPVSPTLLS